MLQLYKSKVIVVLKTNISNLLLTNLNLFFNSTKFSKMSKIAKIIYYI